ncbi:MAG: hypothetical protein HY298_20140 [Verrucomicrobia bacterium]|nr:hypothetical protein [Verrucomicrobiota bacterium]
MPHTFEQQPNESAKAFAAFSVYLGMGAERSLAAVGKQLGKSEPLMKRWSRKFDWLARVQAPAAHLAGVERETTEALTRGKSAEWLKRQQDLRETEWLMHETCIAAAKRGLAAYMEREKVYANLSDIARMLEVASKLGRLASGLLTDKTELTGEDGGPIRLELEAALKKIYGQVEPAPTVADPASSPANVVEVEAVEIEKAESGKQIVEIQSAALCRDAATEKKA